MNGAPPSSVPRMKLCQEGTKSIQDDFLRSMTSFFGCAPVQCSVPRINVMDKIITGIIIDIVYRYKHSVPYQK